MAPENIPIPDPSLLTIVALDKAITGLQTLLEQQIISSKDLAHRSFEGIEKRFSERDRRFDEGHSFLKAALEAAVTSTAKQVDLLLGKIDDLKTRIAVIELRASERVTAIESRQRGIGDSWAVVVAAVASVAAASSIIFAFLNHAG